LRLKNPNQIHRISFQIHKNVCFVTEIDNYALRKCIKFTATRAKLTRKSPSALAIGNMRVMDNFQLSENQEIANIPDFIGFSALQYLIYYGSMAYFLCQNDCEIMTQRVRDYTIECLPSHHRITAVEP
jgi:hypothetical protein